MSDLVQIEKPLAHVSVIRMADAETGNGLTERMIDGLEHALARVASDTDTRAVILAGLPHLFCGGATQAALSSVTSGSLVVKDLALPAQILALPVPTIAALEGAAVGGGLMLGLYCDLTVAAEESRYGLNFTDLGFTPGMGSTAFLPYLVGHARASELLLGGGLYRGRELASWGLFGHVLPRVDVYARALDLAQRFADKPRAVLAMVKEGLAVARRAILHRGLAREDLMHRLSFLEPTVHARIRERYL